MGVPSFVRALAALPENPVAQRELRSLGHVLGDWRLWVGLRLPRDARGWGLPALAWFWAAPYACWGMLALGARFFPQYLSPRAGAGFGDMDFLAFYFVLLGLYVCLLGVVLMAPTLSREREQETWDTLRTTVASPHEILLGLLAGRLAPLLGGFLVTGLFWVLARPHYAPLLQRYAPFRLDGAQTALLVWEVLTLALAAGVLALGISARCRSTGRSMVLSLLGCVGLIGLVAGAAVVWRDVPGPLLIAGVCVPVIGAAYASACAAV